MTASAASAPRCWVLPPLRQLLAQPEGALWRRWLGRAEALPAAPFGARQAVADALAQPLLALPWCDAAAAGAQTPLPALCRVDRIRIRLDGSRLLLQAIEAQPLPAATLDEVNSVLAELSEGGLQLWQGPSGSLLLAQPQAATTLPLLDAAPPDRWLGDDLAQALPQALLWRRIFNALQAVLAAPDPFSAGTAALHSSALWCWGDRRLAASSALPPDHGHQVDDEEIAALLAILGSRAGQPTPHFAEGPVTDPAALAASLRHGPLLLCCSSGERYLLRPRDRWRFWAPRLPVSASAATPG